MNWDHSVQWNKAEIIHNKQNRIFRKLKVSIHQKRTGDESEDVRFIWLPVLWNRKTGHLTQEK